MQGESILDKAGQSCSYLALVGWVLETHQAVDVIGLD